MATTSASLTITFRAGPLRDFCARLLQAVGTPGAHARLVADSLVAANVRGVDSHGIQMLTTYLMQQRAGGINARGTGRVKTRSGVCLSYDGQNAWGQVVAERCVGHAIRLARRGGVSVVVASHSNHFGAASYWGRKMTDAGLIGIVMSNACPAVAPWQGKTAILGTNPICVAVPGTGSGAWLLDMATTTVALGKLMNAAFLNQPRIPREWGFLDGNERVTTRTEAARFARQGAPAPTPFGGYKGTAFAMLAEILSAGLTGGAMATDLPVFRTGGDPLGISHVFLAIDPARFLPLPVFQRQVGRLVRLVKASEPARGFREILVAGEPEARCERIRRREGIPVPKKLWVQFEKIAGELGVSPPRGETGKKKK